MKLKSSYIKKYSAVFSVIVSSSVMVSHQAFADRAAYGTATLNPTQVVVPTAVGANSAAAPQAETIKTVATKNVQNTKYARYAAMGVGVACGYGVYSTCWSPHGAYWCAAYVACIGASIKITNDLGKVTDAGGMTVGAVNFDNLNPGSTPDLTLQDPKINNPKMDAQADINLEKLKKVQKDLLAKGWKIDEKTGAVTSPEGKTYTGDSMSSQQALNNSGLGKLDFKQLNTEMQKIKAQGEALAKGADAAGDSFADAPAGGSGSTSPVAATNPMEAGTHGLAPNGLGLDRNPAQVAGMSKSFNGEVIGVAKDSLFDMVDRRYELLKRDDKFLAP